MLNCDCYITIFETIYLCAEKISGSFKNIVYKMCLQIIYLIYVYKENLALNNLQWLIYHKTNPTKYEYTCLNRICH